MQTVQNWLNGNFDEATKAQILALQETDMTELEDAFYRNLEFGTGGLRGIMGQNEQVHCRYGYTGSRKLYEGKHRGPSQRMHLIRQP